MADPDAGAARRRLIDKWFIDPAAPSTSMPPVTRHKDSKVLRYTDGNRVTLLLDGEAYMRSWAESLSMAAAKPSTHQVWHTGLSLDDVGVQGKTVQGWNALSLLAKAQDAGVGVYGMLSDHGYYGNEENQTTIDTLFKSGVYGIRRDLRYPNLAAAGNCCGANHQKFAVVRNPERPRAFIGSADVHTGRWDRSAHGTPDPNRYGKPTHEVGVMMEGPVVGDLEMTFLERWNDATRNALRPEIPAVPTLPPTTPSTTQVGTHSVQVLHTYGITEPGYSWSPAGEFTVWASYFNAIRKASSYVYIEDQYFMPFDFPPRFAGKPDLGQASDVVYQLGAAIERGVKVLVLVPSVTEEPGPLPKYQKYQRDIGVDYLRGVAARAGRPNDFTIVALSNGTESIYVHAKVMIVDDELAVLGSANVNQKSMTHDLEVDIAVIDSEGVFAKEMRKTLWAEHLGVEGNMVDDALVGYGLMNAASKRPQRTGHIVRYDVTLSQPVGHGQIIRRIDPYAGPPR